MCVPTPTPINLAPSPVPSMQAANNLSLGGDAGNRGAAQLGRLMLRVGGASSATTNSASSSGASSNQTTGGTQQASAAAPQSAPAVGAAPAAATPSFANLKSLQIAAGSLGGAFTQR